MIPLQQSHQGPSGVERRASNVAVNTVTALSARLADLGRALHRELVNAIPELGGDKVLLDLLADSTSSNIEAFLHVARYEIAIEDVNAPPAALEYARRLAQRGISLNALLRAFRLGQSRVLGWVFTEIARQEREGSVAFAAGQILQAVTFGYVDTVAEQVVAECEVHREEWLASRNSLRATTLSRLLMEEAADLSAAEWALGYRLQQQHLGVTLWRSVTHADTSEVGRLEELLSDLAQVLGPKGNPLFMPQDRLLAWGWIPVARSATQLDLAAVEELVKRAGPGFHVAVGRPGGAIKGFRSTHQDAQRAHRVALLAGDDARPVTSFTDPDVRTAALLSLDIESARHLVETALGGLAEDTQTAARLRETLRVFLSEKASFNATAERVHVHRNTVKYRVDRAIELRGRPLDDERLDLELALIAAHWLKSEVMWSRS